MILLYRGQTSDIGPIPSIFRKSWKCFDSKKKIQIDARVRNEIWMHLEAISQRLWRIFEEKDYKIPRKKGFGNIKEIPWAVIQHYELWPTPLIDVTASLQMATAFAMNFQKGKPDNARIGYLYVIGFPHLTGSITFNGDEHFTLARLQSVCPPIARRPHLQEGYLVGHFPIYEFNNELRKKSELSNRLVAKFILKDDGNFWTKDYRIPTRSSLLPVDDSLLKRLVEEFGANSKTFSLLHLAKRIEAGKS